MEPEKIKEMVIHTYDRIAKNYVTAYQSMDEPDWQHWEKFIADLQGKRVLDMGCGTGDASRYMAEKGLNVVGIDLSEEMLSIARKQPASIEWVKGDICACPFGDAEFDGIILSYTLNHLNERMFHKVMAEVERLLKPRGKILLVYHVGVGEIVMPEPLDSDLSIYYHFWNRKSLETYFKDYNLEFYFQRRSQDISELENDKAIVIYGK